MDKDFHVDCYICEECGMQLTDEPDKRCYPFEGRLMCRSCHIQKMQPHHMVVAEPVSASYQYLGWRGGGEFSAEDIIYSEIPFLWNERGAF